MKKIAFFVLSVCISTQSFAGCSGTDMPKDAQKNQFIPSQSYSSTNQKYLKCGGNGCPSNTKAYNLQDGLIYTCDGTEWKRFADDKIETCTNGTKDLYAKDGNEGDDYSNNYPIAKRKKYGSVYLYKHPKKGIGEELDSYCKLSLDECKKIEDKCLREKGDFIASNFGCVYDAAPSTKLTITCKDRGDIECELPHNHGLNATQCSELKGDPIMENKILYTTRELHDRCGKKLSDVIAKSKCPNIQVAHIGDSQRVIFCTTNPNIKKVFTEEPTDKWSYAQKQCVGSWGKWENGQCKCDRLEGTTLQGNECLCKDNPKQKYYNKLWSGCTTLADGVFQAGTKTQIYGFGEYSLSSIDRANSCPPSGGKWGANNTCMCDSETLNMQPDESGYFCNCKSGYDYKNPLVKSEGCIPIKEIPGYNETPKDENPVDKNIEKHETSSAADMRSQACRNTDGTYDESTKKCVCDSASHLKTIEKDGYSICQCMAGYKRNNADNTANGECVDAGDSEEHQEVDTEAMRKAAEDAYKNEYDNEQSNANKLLTAGSSLMTGLGAMQAAQALAEEKADAAAEQDMAAYINTFKCEYNKGKTYNYGNEDIELPSADLQKYYTEYKQIADKLKETKAALGLRPGIESEVLYDSAQSGLYQYQTAEIKGGKETSISRALLNPEGEDAAAWNAQKTGTAKNLKTGALLAAGGIATGVVGNYLINRNHEHTELKEQFKTVTSRLEKEYPEIFTAPQIEPQEEPQPEQPEQLEEPTPVSPAPEKPHEVTIETVNISDQAFSSGSIQLSPEGETALNKAAQDIETLLNKYTTISNISLTAVGYTDPQGLSSATKKQLVKEYKEKFGELPLEYNGKIETNQKLSEVRAKVVLDYLKKNITVTTATIETHPEGKGDEDCKNKSKEEYPSCRIVKVTVAITTTE